MKRSARIALNLEERKLIESYLKKDFSCSKISDLLKRGKNTIVQEVRRNGGKYKYNAKDAQLEHQQRKEAQYVRLSENNKALQENQDTPYSRLITRIQSLEMQLEILFELIKEMKSDKENNRL